MKFERKTKLHAAWKVWTRKPMVFEIVIGVLLLLIAAWMIYLFLWAFSTAMKDDISFAKDPLSLFQIWSIQNYVSVFQNMTVPISNPDGSRSLVGIEGMFINSFVYAGSAAILQTLCTAGMAYITARYKCWFSSFIKGLVIVVLILPIVGALPSTLQMSQTLHLYDSVIGTVLLKFSFTNIYFLVFYGAFEMIPKDYEDAAKIDGASDLSIYVRIMAPMQAPLYGIVTLLHFIQFWNDYQTPMLFMPNHPTIAYGLYSALNSHDAALVSTPAKAAAGILVFVPLFLIFLVFRNRLMGNFSEGGIKG